MPNSLKTDFERGWKAENDGRQVQLGAVIILGSPVLVTMAPVKVGLNGTAAIIDFTAQAVINASQGKSILGK